ncbi:glycine betaine/proline transport system ATP-binding protein [Tranquillimonas rosea]|uniref:Quaternary amine transport ATP-binding protein n=1 Tax=Tranquillimonas rosea TaxID=641238 RepID=A0A1H9UV15_9RHOB|nr:glycine betaine/L-proline ABC transporter ATP-binding protein [Tranquillimonas rosea]SES13191.1 glycine betaine/proline transport system ATP-binding protein [Tranquillimonas rosea]
MSAKLTAKNVYKVFGSSPETALDLVEQGKTKDEIFESTGQTVGVHDASFEVDEGQIFVVMGLSGSGKSTLVRMLNGLIPPTSGSIMVDDTDVASCSGEDLRKVRRDKISMVFQHFALFPHRTVGENAAYGLKVKGVGASERREKAQNALDQVGLGAYADSYPDELSGGMQQRVGLARGLCAESEILLMDEPFSALDPLIRRDMQDELLQLQRSLKKTIIFITHDLNEALILGDKIAIMKDGRFVQVGTAQEIVGEPADDYVAAFTQDIDRSRVFKVKTIANEPRSLTLQDSLADAVERMEKLERDALFITEGDKIAGVLSYREAAPALRNGETTIDPVLNRDYAAVQGEAYLHEIYEAASAGMPIAVMDGDAFVGVVRPSEVFAQLVRGEEAAAEAGDRMTAA